jgi:hypothetical protein
VAGFNPYPFLISPPFFHIFVIVKKLIYIFLNTKYPDAFVKRTVFGNACYHNNDNFRGTNELSKEIGNWFDISKDDAKRYIDSWHYTLPVVVSLRNSTNPTVLVSDTMVVNSTL